MVLALALINHLADHGNGPVNEVAVLRATTFSDYLESHARRIYASGTEFEVAAAKAILARIRRGDLQDGFTPTDIHGRGWSGLENADQIRAGLDLLVGHDWIADEIVKTLGRPKTVYRINPKGVAR